MQAIFESEAFGESSALLRILSNQVHELDIETGQLVEEPFVIIEFLRAEPDGGVVRAAVAGGSDLILPFERITGTESCLTEAIADLAVLHATYHEPLAAARREFAFLGGLAETVRRYRAPAADLNFDDLMALSIGGFPGRPLSPHRRPNRRL